jgi:hypothetical protein
MARSGLAPGHAPIGLNPSPGGVLCLMRLIAKHPELSQNCRQTEPTHDQERPRRILHSEDEGRRQDHQGNRQKHYTELDHPRVSLSVEIDW